MRLRFWKRCPNGWPHRLCNHWRLSSWEPTYESWTVDFYGVWSPTGQGGM